MTNLLIKIMVKQNLRIKFSCKKKTTKTFLRPWFFSYVYKYACIILKLKMVKWIMQEIQCIKIHTKYTTSMCIFWRIISKCFTK